MEWKFSGNRPVYLQIKEQIRAAVIAGEYGPGARMPSVRELAAQAGVNPNTMQRALWELEQEELLTGSGTTGRWVTENELVLSKLRQEAVDQILRACSQQFRSLGLTMAEAAALLEKMEKEE